MFVNFEPPDHCVCSNHECVCLPLQPIIISDVLENVLKDATDKWVLLASPLIFCKQISAAYYIGACHGSNHHL